MVRTRRASSASCFALALALAGCSGAIEDQPDLPDPGSPGEPAGGDPGVQAPGAPAPASPAVTPPRPGAPAAPPAPPPAFTTVRETLRLLPFDTRLNRLAVVMGLSSSDKLFDGLRARRLELGDQDFGKGVTPDPSWSPNRMSLWIEVMRPICQSSQMTMKFPSLRTDPAPLIGAAWGRPAEAADLDAVRVGLAGVPDERKTS